MEMYLSDHNGEGKDSNKVVDELKDNLKEGGGVRQTTDGDQRLHGKVVAANVAESKTGGRAQRLNRKMESNENGQEPFFSQKKFNKIM